MPHKIGLVLAGGGGKGAYEVGVWKALVEYGIAENISVISGTSVGALNAPLFALNHIDTIERVWNEIRPGDILYFDIYKQVEKIIKFLISYINPALIFRIGFIIREQLLYGTFSRKGLSRIIDQYLDFNKINGSKQQIYVTCTQLTVPPKIKRFLLNDESSKKAKNIVLASSAMPFIFPQEEIDGKKYYDGGLPVVGDNVPVDPVYEENCDIIIAVLLNRHDYIKTEKYPNSKFILIYPQFDPGGLIKGTLNFRNAREKIQKGYNDAKRVIKPIYDMAKSQFLIGKMLDQIKIYDEQFKIYMFEMETKGKEIDESIEKLWKDVNSL